MSDELENKVIETVAKALATANKTPEKSILLTRDSKMNEPKEWDSLSFVAVMVAVSEEFDLEFDDDDAIAFTSIKGIVEMISFQ